MLTNKLPVENSNGVTTIEKKNAEVKIDKICE